MEESMKLSHRKDSLAVLDSGDVTPSEDRLLTTNGYPFAAVLRLRVLQIVCGFSSLVMGAVAFIEERGKLNLGLGMPAGIVTVAAAALSIHTSRGFSGYSQPSCKPPLSLLRFLGPTVRAAIPLTLLWLCSVVLYVFLLVFCLAAVLHTPPSRVIAGILLVITVINLTAVVLVVRIDCRYDPD